MSISLDEVRHVAKLARLEMGEADLVALQSELNALLGHFQDINAIDVTGCQPKPHAVPRQNVWADDEPVFGLPREAALQNAAAAKAGLFLVPTIIED
ncbi:MAG: Asp-tRNA(Asn)/Glu-tRNA(Gln) amidotransferase subunit GatC [Chthonomonas sp.]|nr:Asp-tRNA(Asn)/Glu-tRNA(Gln) amidotransferase subunit GatC [Chthonomonas sp.]